VPGDDVRISPARTEDIHMTMTREATKTPAPTHATI